MVSYPAHYNNTFNPAKNRTDLAETEDSYFFGTDSNTRHEMRKHQLKSVADAVLRDGDRITGATLSINAASGVATITEGQVYINGFVRVVGAHQLQIPETGKVQVGVMIKKTIVTSLDDPDLTFKNQSFETHNEPLSPQIEEWPSWELATEVPIDTAAADYSFYPIYDIQDRVVLDNTPPPELSGFNAAIARYDQEANGHYVVKGFKASLLSSTADKVSISIEEGTANVSGLKIDRDDALRMTFDADPDLETINAEPHFFEDAGAGTLKITLNRTPVAEVTDVSVLEEKTVSIIRGQSNGGRDPLPDAQIARVISVSQASTDYEIGTDFQKLGDQIDWSPFGDEPATGSTYSVTYQYKRSIVPDETDHESVTVSGAVTSSQVDIDYKWKMPRIDLITVDRTGVIDRLKGVSRPYDPAVPSAPTSNLVLAQIHHKWDDTGSQQTIIKNIATQNVPMSDIEDIRNMTISAFREIGRMQLIVNATNANGYAKSEIFVDNFDNDEQRDIGVEQELAIVNGVLTLPIVATVIDGLTSNASGWFNEVVLSPVIEQRQATGSMKVNPYQSFNPIPARVTLNPAFDQWTQPVETWASSVTRRLADWTRAIGAGRFSTSTTVEQETEITEQLSSRTVQDENLRVRDVDYTLQGFGPNEELSSLTFDGIEIDLPNPAPQADANGEMSGTFTIPEGLTAGSKNVQFIGSGGSMGEGSYIGRGIIEITEMRRVTQLQRITTTRRWGNWDPLGYLWTPPRDMYIGAVRVKVAAIGDPNNPIIMQISNTLASQPTGVPLAEIEVSMQGVEVGDELVFNLPIPLWVEGFNQLANVWLTDDADHALVIAELGKFDPVNGWVRSQPSVNMVTIASSNNTAFEFHHDRDLWTVIEEATFNSTSRTIELGQLPSTAITDLVALAGVESPTAETEVELVLERSDGSEIRMLPNQVVSLSEELDEELNLKAFLKGTNQASPILFPNIQLVLGALQEAGTYQGRTVKCGDDKTVEVVTMERTIGTSSFTISVKDANGDLVGCTVHSQEDVGDGWYKRVYRSPKLSTPTTCAHVSATGSALHRPAMAYITAVPLAI